MNPFYTAVSERAGYRCEYCKAPEVVFNFPFEVEHIIPLSKQGDTDEANLALACRSCNLRKGNRICGAMPGSNTEFRFFHPRKDEWREHFQVTAESDEIIGMTQIGKITVAYSAMNSPAQLSARQLWIRLGLFP